MPRLHGYREHIKFNVYDCLNGSGRDHRSMRLFGNANIGNAGLCNLAIPGQFASDATAIVTNWYARTNIPASDALEAFVNGAIATLHIGSRNFWQGPLRDLLRRKEGDGEQISFGETEEAEIQRRAAELAVVDDMAADLRMVAGQSGDVDDKWRAIARAAIRKLAPRNILIIPARQNFDVCVEIYGGAEADWRLEKAFADAMPGAVHPRIWIHLEGWATRDIY